MPIVFPDIDALETYVDTYIKNNGNEEISGDINNNALNGCIEFIRQSPLNWEKASVVNSSGAVVASTSVVVFTGSTPSSLTWGDNIYNEYVFINMTVNAIPIGGSLGYYNLLGQYIQEIPAYTAIDIVKASNDLWVQGNNTGTSSEIAQKEPTTFVVGTTPNAPTNGSSTWTYAPLLNSWILLIWNGFPLPVSDPLNGNLYTTKPLASDTLTLGNGTFSTGDIITYILITP